VLLSKLKYNINRHGPANSWQVCFDKNILVFAATTHILLDIVIVFCRVATLIVLLLFIPRAESNAKQSLNLKASEKDQAPIVSDEIYFTTVRR
jgi:hypothetical protein